MVTEGTYPQAFGGVSVWCDQLVRGMPQHEFGVTALTVTGEERPVWTLPTNVTVNSVPLWPSSGTATERWRPAPRGVLRRRIADAYRELLRALLLEPSDSRGTAALRELSELAQRGRVAAVLRSDDAVNWLLQAWQRAPDDIRRGITASAYDALTATEMLTHWLRPLLCSAPVGDVTHAVSNGLAASVALSAKWNHGTPMLLTEHGVYLRERYLSFAGHRYHWPVKVTLLGFLRLLCFAAYRTADLITPGNQYNRRWEQRCGASPAVIETVYNGVEPTAFPPAGREPDVPTVTWAGRVDPIKDLETLLRAFALVRKEIPLARLRMFGGTPAGNEGYRDRCVALVDCLGLGEAVTFEGRVQDIRDAYVAGHVVVLSSISEGFPYTLIEAMTSGRATVSTDVGGVAEAVADTGLVVPPRDPPAMADACVRLLGDELLRHRLGSAARRRALEFFTVDKAVDAFDGIYADLARAVVAVRTRRPSQPDRLERSA
jgi:glycosyltransferase involved in cell wall biosynthesis